ncbi:MAG: ATP-binding protein [Idiomarina sp.]|nr:ATP-binding protein [Idiomarina sp.]
MMAQLSRIILIHTHLPGVVELDLTGHANICGTNASGKTTLQRLVPVFYGEQPNKVVPKTRDRFDVFYLPFQNSYLIYEYEVGGQPKQVVLTKRADGVDYRFVDAAYHSEHYLDESLDGVQGVSYQQWAQRLRDLGVSSSHKISATSEYRAIIQNDLSAMRSNRKDNLKLRQLAGRYALVGGHQRLRHIEKLVSAVHAKEGKMDTLKSMLATILEEDGYQRPELSFKPAKIRAWIKEMRQFMRMDDLQQQFEKIGQRMADTAGSQTLLWQLKPLIDEDKQTLKIQLADKEAELSELRQQREALEQDYERQHRELVDAKSETQSTHQQLERNLKAAEQKRAQYVDSGIEEVEQNLKSLHLWQQEAEEKQQHLALMMEKNEDIAQKIEQRKNQLAENLDRLQRKNQKAADSLRHTQNQLREQQADTLARLQQELGQAQQQQQEALHQRLQTLHSERATLQAQLDIAPLSAAEREAMQLADARIDDAQLQLATHSDMLRKVERTAAQAKEQRQHSDHQLTRARQLVHQAQQDLQQLQRQLDPVQGSLRHFLRQHQPGWEQSLGKVVAESLLERTDLAPSLSEQTTTLFGVTLDLSAIEQPGYAADEVEVQTRLEQARHTHQRLIDEQEQAEKQLNQTHQAAQDAADQVRQVTQQVRRTQQDLDYAREAKRRLHSEHESLIKQRQQAHRQRIEDIKNDERVQRDGYDQAVQRLRHDYKALELEHRADFQEQLDSIDEDLALYQQQVDELRETNKQQVRELEKQVNQELAAAGVDSQRLQTLKSDIVELRERISTVKERQHELAGYQEFMRSTWNQQRPQWLTEEQQARATLENLTQQLAELKARTHAQRETYRSAEKDLKGQLTYRQKLCSELETQLQRFVSLMQQEDFAADVKVEAVATDFGDVAERIERLCETLNQYQDFARQLRDQCDNFSALLRRDASADFEQMIDREFATLADSAGIIARAKVLGELLNILNDQQLQIVEQGRNIGGGLQSFFKVFDDVNRKVGQYSRRLTEVVGDDLALEGINRSEVKISSTVDELGFWQPLKELSQLYQRWSESGELLPSDAYLDRLADVADLLRADQEYSFESLLKLELYLNERGSELIIRNDRQLLESSSHGMAYLILCKFLLAFTRLLRGDSEVVLHWPIDEIGTLAYHNVERLFTACDSNHIQVVGAFPNPESDVLLLFKHRYLIEAHKDLPGKGQLKRIQPRVSALSAKLAEKLTDTAIEESV